MWVDGGGLGPECLWGGGWGVRGERRLGGRRDWSWVGGAGIVWLLRGGVWNRWMRLVGSEWKGKVEIGKHTVRNAKYRFLHIAIYIQQ